MTITKNLENDRLSFILEGRLDTLTAPELEKEFTSLDQVNSIVFDMKDLEYISSAGLRTLLKAKKEIADRGTVKIINSNDTVKEVFEVTGFDNLLDIE